MVNDRSVCAHRTSAGAALPDALRPAAAGLSNRHARATVETTLAKVEAGETLSSALYYQAFFPKTLAWGVSLGEKRGDLPAVLGMFGRIYRSNLGRDYEMVHTILTPLGIVVLGELVLFFAMALFLPIIKIQQHLGGG